MLPANLQARPRKPAAAPRRMHRRGNPRRTGQVEGAGGAARRCGADAAGAAGCVERRMAGGLARLQPPPRLGLARCHAVPRCLWCMAWRRQAMQLVGGEAAAARADVPRPSGPVRAAVLRLLRSKAHAAAPRQRPPSMVSAPRPVLPVPQRHLVSSFFPCPLFHPLICRWNALVHLLNPFMTYVCPGWTFFAERVLSLCKHMRCYAGAAGGRGGATCSCGCRAESGPTGSLHHCSARFLCLAVCSKVVKLTG